MCDKDHFFRQFPALTPNRQRSASGKPDPEFTARRRAQEEAQELAEIEREYSFD
ncbi:hypothetical protein K6Y31_20535 [Motilimonas cestriensis]|uniref:Uncharacterized protein n=1 Tax=Motilimonas cestriensis TaxID=2742685 RepID=A0ABS8WFW7_9GAMM|nr:hypothetical protein [Motilimonas cestriensis]MCE2597165.1 hypothetical protein [Motilimonas cestriensis]